MFELTTVHFNELNNYNDCNSIVMTATTITNEDIPSVIEFFKESGLCPATKNVIAIKRILDNVLGDEGRTDWLVVFDDETTTCNVMKRLMYGSWIKWTSDFIVNYADDYASVE